MRAGWRIAQRDVDGLIGPADDKERKVFPPKDLIIAMKRDDRAVERQARLGAEEIIHPKRLARQIRRKDVVAVTRLIELLIDAIVDALHDTGIGAEPQHEAVGDGGPWHSWKIGEQPTTDEVQATLNLNSVKTNPPTRIPRYTSLNAKAPKPRISRVFCCCALCVSTAKAPATLRRLGLSFVAEVAGAVRLASEAWWRWCGCRL